jgi:putative protease
LIELLSPARDLETGVAAVNCGADAVYIGAARFGARAAVGNALADIEALARYAHRYWASVYVTLNTLLYDDELEDAARLARQLYHAGVDALIVQDTGLLELALPPLPLFASTQMHNHSVQRVKFLEKVGFQRVILARELTLEQIREIRAATSLELETFVHGALCVSYSGQCAMSYALGGRSGNRGQCAQPCRCRYTLLDGDGRPRLSNRYLLSLRDLNLFAHLEDLLDAGVTSFKIEGRLKDRGYVMNVVAAYRRRLDALLEERALRPAASGRCQHDFTPDLVKTFNRGYTRYFLLGPPAWPESQEMASLDTAKSTGELLGKIVAVRKYSFILDETAPPLHPGDGLCFFDALHELQGTLVNRVQGREIFPGKMDGLHPGLAVYRNHDRLISQALQRSRAARRLRVNFRLAYLEGHLHLEAVDEDGVCARGEVPAVLDPADKPAQALDTITRQLGKLGDTIFELGDVQIAIQPPRFIPLAMLNALRRQVIAALELERLAQRPRRQGGALRNDFPFPEKRLAYWGNVLNHQAAAFYRRHGVEHIEPAAESGLEMRGRKVMTTRYCLRRQLGACLKEDGAQTLPGPLQMVDEQGNLFGLAFDCQQCVMEITLVERAEAQPA